jgi:membrane protease subunit HflK
MYLETMQQIYSSVTKVLVDTRQGSNMLFMPLDRILQQVSQGGAAVVPPPPDPGAPQGAAPAAGMTDARTRDGGRSRERETR